MQSQYTIFGFLIEKQNLFELSHGKLLRLLIQRTTTSLCNDCIPIIFVSDSDDDFGLIKKLLDFLCLGKQVTDLQPLYTVVLFIIQSFEFETGDFVVQVDHQIVVLRTFKRFLQRR